MVFLVSLDKWIWISVSAAWRSQMSFWGINIDLSWFWDHKLWFVTCILLFWKVTVMTFVLFLSWDMTWLSLLLFSVFTRYVSWKVQIKLKKQLYCPKSLQPNKISASSLKHNLMLNKQRKSFSLLKATLELKNVHSSVCHQNPQPIRIINQLYHQSTFSIQFLDFRSTFCDF